MTKISALPADTSPTANDYIPTLDSDTSTTKKVTLDDVKNLYLDDLWWEEIGRTTLAIAGDTISVTSLPARKHLKLIITVTDTGGTVSGVIRFNNDSSANYSRRYSVNGAADTTETSQTSILANSVTAANPQKTIMEIFNIGTDEKICIFTAIGASTAGAATAPTRVEGAGKWVNTTDQINRIDFINLGTGDYAIGSEVIVLGHD